MAKSASYTPFTNGDQDVIESVFPVLKRYPAMVEHRHGKMQLCDQTGVVVIDEVPAVGLQGHNMVRETLQKHVQVGAAAPPPLRATHLDALRLGTAAAPPYRLGRW